MSRSALAPVMTMMTTCRCRNLVLCLLIGVAGCADHPDPVARDSGISDGGSDPDTAAAGPGLAGVLKDEADQPLAYEQVLACMSTLCLFGDTDANGRFFFAIEPPAMVALKTLEDYWDSPRRGATLCPVEIVDTSLKNVGSIYIPFLPEGAPIGAASDDPQTLLVGDGLEVTLRRADLRPRLGDALVAAAARAIPPERMPPLPAVEAEQVVAVYALHPFAATSASPIAVRAASSLPPGTRVTFQTISEIDGAFSEPVSGRADGAFVATDPGTGITELTWLVISQEQ